MTKHSTQEQILCLLNSKEKLISIVESNFKTISNSDRTTILTTRQARYLSPTELDNSIFYIGGPSAMLNAMKKLLQEDLDIPKERMKVGRV